MKSASSSLNVFVYGTLKPGEINYLSYCEGKVVSQISGYVRGDLYALPAGYPAMTEGNNQVYGVLLTFNNANDANILTSLDLLENYQPQRLSELNQYNRRLVTVYDTEDRAIAQAWAYFMTTDKIRQHQGIRLASGSWTGNN